MTPSEPLDRTLCHLAAVSEELLRQLERRDPRYLESLEKRQQLLAELARILPAADPPPMARAALERIRQLGELCQRQASAIRREAEDALAAVGRELAYADSLRRLACPPQPPIVDLEG
jgi:hypothetical protein